jgi:hypothetical protein
VPCLVFEEAGHPPISERFGLALFGSNAKSWFFNPKYSETPTRYQAAGSALISVLWPVSRLTTKKSPDSFADSALMSNFAESMFSTEAIQRTPPSIWIRKTSSGRPKANGSPVP